MTALRPLFPALAISTLAVLPVEAGERDAPSCGVHVPSLEIILNHGAADRVEAVMAALLDDPAVQGYLASLSMEEAKDWFAILFHPAVVYALVDAPGERRAHWGALADLVEAAYLSAMPLS